ncbi:DUF4132 domain-containing protein [Actinomadura xylanilytica]|uniref:DUF4132 domain-containing protein n=1 Tax=Actinomadura xylanilytica TaxID=887459 RepID=UPI00255AEBC7|nr:DUF4132 domain-containing protein [Actinomadura xylanilytica]MDL4770853.1 DUF4132 domain-containing protein [Actinomadura xylanilytica]
MPTFGLDRTGRLDRDLGDGVTATITVAPPGTVTVNHSTTAERPPDPGRPVGRSSLRCGPFDSDSPGGRPPDPRRVVGRSSLRCGPFDWDFLVRHVTAALNRERAAFEAMLPAGHRWPLARWRDEILAHPLSAAVACGLVWEVETGEGATLTGLPARDGDGWALTTVDGTRVALAGGATARLWHPVDAGSDEVRAWRAALGADPARQPFDQVFRSVHLIAPAERETRSYSNRFAAHLLSEPALGPLVRAGRWAWTSDGRAESWIERDELSGAFADGGWQARFYVDEIEDGHFATDQVRFYRREDADWHHVDLETVPPRVFSDAMRDVETWVAACSVAADPGWSDTGAERRPAGAWRAAAFGDLTETAERRREVLAGLLPGLRAADRMELTDRFLRVRGTLRTYDIHLGSGNIRMRPDDTYLCVVASRSRDDPGFLPSDGDRRLSLILSKALLLADDAAITDPTITAQLRRR